jgi:regulator of protease activity HflC (stomatin/prohibitin superfamily)
MQERQVKRLSGWIVLPVAIAIWLLVPAIIFYGITHWIIPHQKDAAYIILFVVAIIFNVLLAIFLSLGFFTLQPNEARVLILFGKYVGTVKKDGFHWANAFTVLRGSVTATREGKGQVQFARSKSKYRVSLRARNFQTDTVKVNDQRGNPIEIGAVVVWRVADTVKALFDVDDYEQYVKVQSETAVRHLANMYPYDQGDDNEEVELTLRGSSETINNTLKNELQSRLAMAGVAVEETRLTHLAYAPEIAGVMLRRQQAEAIIAARKKIVHGAVSMVEMALAELSAKDVVKLDEEHKATMVGNLLVVLCGEAQAEPVINAGTLYR